MILVRKYPLDIGFTQSGESRPEHFRVGERAMRFSDDERTNLIANDPNGWFENPRDLIVALRRIVHVSVETARIIQNLPGPLAEAIA